MILDRCRRGVPLQPIRTSSSAKASTCFVGPTRSTPWAGGSALCGLRPLANTWTELRYDALLSMEYRIAAEHLLMLREDLAQADLADQLPPVSTTWREARHSRLVVDARERAETLLDFRLTDHPAVVVALEGETEMALAPRVLALMGMDERQGTIQLVNLKSVDGDVRLLARAVAVPRIDPEGRRGARVLRPLTALMIAVDQENAYATPAGCEKVKQSVVEELLSSLPPTIRTQQMRADLEHLVHVRTW